MEHGAPPTPPENENGYWAEAIEEGHKFYYRANDTTVEITEHEFHQVVSNPFLYYFSTALRLHYRINQRQQPEADPTNTARSTPARSDLAPPSGSLRPTTPAHGTAADRSTLKLVHRMEWEHNAMQIELCLSSDDKSLEERIPSDSELVWERVASGYWSQDAYHSGYIEYHVAQAGSGHWLLKSLERNTELDDVTQDDIDEGRLTDDQEQALWGMALEEARNAIYERVVAACAGAPSGINSDAIGKFLYAKVCESGGKRIDVQD